MGKLTETFVKRVKPPQTGYAIHSDGEIDGFGLRVTQAGQKSFVLTYTDLQHRQKRYTIGKYPGDYSAATARTRVQTLREGIRQGKDPFSEKKRLAQEAAEAEARERTVKDLADAYMAEHVTPHRRPKTANEYQALIDNHILPSLGRFRVASVTEGDVERLHTTLKATPYLANRMRAVISAMFTWAKAKDAGKWGTDKNPAAGVERYHEEPQERWLTLEEMQRLARVLDKFPDDAVADMECSEKQKNYHRQQALSICNAIRLLLLTGARKMEALSATWAQFDLDRGVWTKPSHHTKQRRTEHVPLGPKAVELLGSIPRNGPYVFPGRHKDEHLSDIKTAWHQIRTAAKMPDLRLHHLRHNLASHLVSNQQSLETVGALLGHTQPSTTKRYSHFGDHPLREAVNTAENVIPITAKTMTNAGDA